jgi:ElaB/YqjD/DUF883 family membrane-anchored ribosome-binding protein
MSRQIRLASTRAAADQLNDDVKGVIDDAEALVQATADLGGEKLTAIRDRAEQSLKAVQARMTGARDAVVNRTRAEVDAADLYVHENPWRSIGMAAGAGFLFGALLCRRS